MRWGICVDEHCRHSQMKRRNKALMKIILLLIVLAGMIWMSTPEATAQSDSVAIEPTSSSEMVMRTHWTRSTKFSLSQETGNWEKTIFADSQLDTSKLVVPYTTLYGTYSLQTSFPSYGFENEWSFHLGNLTKDDDFLALNLGIGGVYGTIPKTGISNQAVTIRYYGTSSGTTLKQGTATYTYDIRGTYAAGSVPLTLEWRYGMKAVSLNVRVGIIYRLASVTAEHKFFANGFPADYDVSKNEGRFTYFNDNDLTESFDHKVSKLLFDALPFAGLSTRLPLTSWAGTDDGYGIIVGADFGAMTRLYIALSY